MGKHMIFADVIVDISVKSLDRPFQYIVPEEMHEDAVIGAMVIIPFGSGNRELKGYIIGLSGEAKFDVHKTKEIKEIVKQGVVAESHLLSLAYWIKENYGSTMNDAIKAVLPVRREIKKKITRMVYPCVVRSELEQILQEYARKHYKAKVRVLQAILDQEDYEEGISYEVLQRDHKATPAVLRSLQEQEVVRISESRQYRNPVHQSGISDRPPVLNQEQQVIVDAITADYLAGVRKTYLIHGVTGSGKTEVYMRIIEQVIAQGQQVIMLIPEIALTYQTVRRFYARFGDKVSVINSRQSQGERYDQFKRAKKGEVQVMIGPRSALFTPFASLGLIIIDEEHEPSYKSESTPRYHARETAIRRAVLEHANVVMGSATPSVEAYSKAMNGEYSLVRLTTRYGSRPLPRVSIVDLREELKAGNRSVLSRELRQKMKGRFEKKEQVMLFLNRRGYAGFVSCRSCGHVMKCPHCDVSLSEHNNERLLCHYCGYETGKPRICPVCGSPYIGGFKAGTQQIEKVVREDFPEVRTLRMDFDTTRTKGSYEKILAAFAAHEADILIGTQMIVKGHDFPDVTLMGIVAADLSLNAEDYRCAERTFQLLCQAVGRGGRGEKPGEAVIQTYHPDHYSIQAAAVQDYQAFYEEEMSYRMLLDYPPVAHMLAVLGSGPEDEKLVQAMYYLKLYIERIYRENDLHIIGPAYASVGKVKDIYRQVIYLKHKDHKTLVHIKDQLEKYIEINSGFRKIYIQFDFS